MKAKQFQYEVTFRIGSREVVVNVEASCVGNAKAIARGKLDEDDYRDSEFVSISHYPTCRPTRRKEWGRSE